METRIPTLVDVAAVFCYESAVASVAVCNPCRYAKTAVTVGCRSSIFTVKGKTVLASGWKAYIKQKQAERPFTDFTEEQALTVSSVSSKGGKTTPPKHFTEDRVFLLLYQGDLLVE